MSAEKKWPGEARATAHTSADLFDLIDALEEALHAAAHRNASEAIDLLLRFRLSLVRLAPASRDDVHVPLQIIFAD